MKDLDLITMAAMRYALPRRSYIVGAVQDFIRENITDEMTKQKMAKEIKEWVNGELSEWSDSYFRESWQQLYDELSENK